jgi:hypothetical protein
MIFLAVVVGLICGSTLYVVEGLHLEMMMKHHNIADNKSELFGSSDCDEHAMGKDAELDDCDEIGTLPALTVDKEWDGKLDKLARGEAEGLWFKSGKLWFKVKEGNVKAEL